MYKRQTYYSSKETITRIRQKSSDLRRIVQTALERNYKKYDLQLKQLKDTEKREKYRIYGELLNTYGYELSGGDKEFPCINYYTCLFYTSGTMACFQLLSGISE